MLNDVQDVPVATEEVFREFTKVTHTWEHWHMVVGRSENDTLKQTFRCFNLRVIVERTECSPCVKEKYTLKSLEPRNLDSVVTDKLDRVHTDLRRPFPTPFFRGNLYMMILQDKATNYCWVLPMLDKAHVPFVFSE